MKTDNELIAKFMGLPFSAGMYSHINYEGEDWGYEPENLEYHKSWDWLMPVVEKIEATPRKYDNQGYKHTVTIWNNCCIVSDGNNGNEIVKIYSETKVEATYKAVVEFIKWYKQQKP